MSVKARFIVILAMVMASLFVAGGTANAGGPIVYNQRGSYVPMRWAPTSNAGVTEWIRNSTRVNMVCWTDFQWYNGNYSSNRWFYVQSFATGRYDYVHSSHVYYQSTVPRC